MNIGQLFGGLEDHDEDRPKISREGEIAILQDALAAFNQKHEFHVGMIVRPKSCCPLYEEPSDNSLGIVVEVLDAPILNEDAKPGTAHYQEMMDIRIGQWHAGKGKFLIYHVDSRRYEPAPLD